MARANTSGWGPRRLGAHAGKRWWGTPLVLYLLLFLLPVMSGSGCAPAQSSFARSAGNAGSTCAAAALTLRFAHEGKLTSAYARASFVNFAEQLRGLDSQLPTQTGAPSPATLARLRALQAMVQAVGLRVRYERIPWDGVADYDGHTVRLRPG